jgi:hypothetical protein
MQGLPSAILRDQRELARLPEASVSKPIQAFSLFVNAAKGLGGEPREGYVFRLAGGRHFVVHQRFLTLSGNGVCVSNSIESGPRIGVQKVPLAGRNDSARPRRSWSGLRSRGERGGGRGL